MKAALILGDGVRQICLQPESDEEKAILKMFSVDQNIQVGTKFGSIYDRGTATALGATVGQCHGGYYRVYENSDALMLILTPKPAPEPEIGPIVMPE